MGTYKPEFQDNTIGEIKDKTTEPPMFKVLLHNDDFTTKTFVVEVLMGIFKKAFAEAAALMWHVHKNGTGLIDIYTFEVAETKVKQTTALAKEHGFPLKITMEQEWRRFFNIDVHERLAGNLAGTFVAVPNLINIVAEQRFQGIGETESEALKDCLSKIKAFNVENLFPQKSD